MFGMDFKRMFFDSKTVRSKTDRATRRVLSRFGAFVRQTARRSIRKRKGRSKAGTPPSSHVGLLKRFIFFGYDVVRRSVVIGPLRLTKRGRGTAPQILETGGRAMLFSPKKKRMIRSRFLPRPYMGPAFKKEQSNLPRQWRDSIK